MYSEEEEEEVKKVLLNIIAAWALSKRTMSEWMNVCVCVSQEAKRENKKKGFQNSDFMSESVNTLVVSLNRL